MESNSLKTMKRVLWTASLLCLLGMAACKPREKAVVTPEPPVDGPTVVCGSELSRGTAQYRDPLTSMEALVEGDCMRLKVAYSGGCKEHAFDMYWSGEWDKTKPPVAHLYLSHQANGDNCEAIKSDKLGFSLNQIRFPGNGQVIVEVHAEGVPMKRVSYSYK
ncbi:MAG TPA: hypothetical protein VHS96_09255 [Bacteroidia bacterium]|nr:hypothetical protein [Bacteroidia bacterium]